MTGHERIPRGHGSEVDAVEKLAQETHRPRREAQAVYEAHFTELERGARITEYVALFAYRRARETLLRSPGHREQHAA